MKHYDISDLDDNGQVKFGTSLLLATVFLSRQIFYGPVALLTKLKGRRGSGSEIDLSWLAVSSFWEFAACLPALFVLVLLFKRRAGAPGWVERGWILGRHLLIAGAVAQIAVMLGALAAKNISLSTPLLGLLLFHFYLLFYFWHAQRVKDVFVVVPGKQSKVE